MSPGDLVLLKSTQKPVLMLADEAKPVKPYFCWKAQRPWILQTSLLSGGQTQPLPSPDLNNSAPVLLSLPCQLQALCLPSPMVARQRELEALTDICYPNSRYSH